MRSMSHIVVSSIKSTEILNFMLMQITFAVNLTLSQGMNLLPFSDSNKQALLTPINTFLGDHGTANITNAIEGSNQVFTLLGEMFVIYVRGQVSMLGWSLSFLNFHY